MATVNFDKVSKVYPDGTEAIRDLSLAIRDGELMVLVGPSGCGKSTVLRLLAGLEQPSQGEIRIGDRRVNEQTPQQRNVAMVFQNYSLYPHMTVRKNLAFPLKVAGCSRRETARRIEQAAEMLGLTDLLDRRPGQLSGGQSQRVAMGRAIVRNPEVFLMDEPLSNLDAKLRVQIRRDIVDLQQQMNTTMIYVTHDQVEAMTLGQRVAVLDQGRLQQVATPEVLYTRPENVFVATFIGSPGMNLFPARLATDNQGAVLVEIFDLRPRVPPSRIASGSNLKHHPGRQVIAGLRPEALAMAQQRSDQPRIEVTIRSVEVLGHETLVYCTPWQQADAADIPAPMAAGNLDNKPLIARLPGDPRLSVGQKLSLFIDMDRLHLFDRQGQRLRQ